MSQNNKTVYVISGANRGIGFAFVETFSKRPNHVIYAGARMPEEAKALHELSQSRPGSIKIVKLDSGSEKDMQAIASQIEAEEGHADVVIANAGITIHEAQAKTLDVKYEYIREHIEVNTFGPLYLYRAMYPVLQKANKGAKFITISSRLGSNGCMEDFPMDTSAYGVSKAAINFLLRKTHFETEEEGFVVFPICPNWVSTFHIISFVVIGGPLFTYTPLYVLIVL